MIDIVVAQPKHLDAIVAIAEQAKKNMAAMGIDQWQRGYPNRDIWTSDIAAQGLYVALQNERVVGVLRYYNMPDAAYKTIEGDWLTAGPYATIHRCAVDANLRGQGIMGKLFTFACDKATTDKMESIRIDTHKDNSPMLQAIKKAGFTLCGTITLVEGVETGSTRIGFEKMLSLPN
ncbi:GNAT family N-acetyltransferase [Adlercreutzia sp. ZJ304]|uniref:GNAT family N-acetyltransferase n=1 Tax=Adlercreutzia sp. ZJ304 TaxID=2709791 RepID=UPI0013ED8947|nr:GNAT family N-acetyltransferase [Adlercreutzia sp. ZJ304]